MENSFSIERPLTNVPSFISKWTKATAFRGLMLEFFGTAFYTYGISCSRSDPLLMGLSLFTPLVFLIDFSGAFFNPAITIVKIIKPNPKMPLFLGILYIAVQIFGALFSGLLSYLLFKESGTPYISENRSISWSFSGFFGETFGSFVFVGLVLIQTCEETRLTEDRIFGPFIIMIGFMVGRAYTFQTGGCLNPGIALGLEVFEAMRYDDAGRMKYLWLYILAPILGGLLALWFYLKVYLPFYLQRKSNKVSMLSFSGNWEPNKEKTKTANENKEGAAGERESSFKPKKDMSLNIKLHRRSKSFDKSDFQEKKMEESIMEISMISSKNMNEILTKENEL